MITSSNKKDMGTEEDEDDDDEEVSVIITSKLELVLAAKSRKLKHTSSPVVSHHVSLSLLSSPDDLSHSRASVPFSWEEERGKPKHHHVLRAPPYSKRLHLPPRLLLPLEFTKIPLVSDHHLLSRLKRWFRWKKERELMLWPESVVLPFHRKMEMKRRSQELEVSIVSLTSLGVTSGKFHGRRRS